MLRAGVTYGVALLAALTSANAQQYLTEVADRPFACPTIGNQQECAIVWEKRLVAAHPGLITRHGQTLEVALFNGRRFKIDDSEQANNVIDLTPGGRFLAIRRQHVEGNSWDLLDRRTGVLTEIFGYPLFSPDGSAFVAAAVDLDAQFSDTVLDIYGVTGRRIARQYSGINPKTDSNWGPTRVHWRGNDTVEFTMLNVDGSSRNAKLVRRHGRWTLGRAR